METPSPDLAAEFTRLYGAARFTEVVERASALWPTLDATGDRSLGEVCRMAMLACLRLERTEESRVWRARSYTQHFFASSARGLAMLVMTEVFVVADYSRALEILAEMERLLRADRSPADELPTGDVAWRCLHEKRAFALFRDGRYSEACAAYDRALEFTATDRRGEGKVRGGRALCEYLADPGGEAGMRAIATTRSLTGADQGDEQLRSTAKKAHDNLDLMERGVIEPSRFIPYETL